jgi:NADPH-dependent ferric siderophore reductase
MSRYIEVAHVYLEGDCLLIADEAAVPSLLEALDEHPTFDDVLSDGPAGGDRVALGIGAGDYTVSVKRDSSGRIVAVLIEEER